MKKILNILRILIVVGLVSFSNAQGNYPVIFDCEDFMIDENLDDDARLMVSSFHQTIVKTSIGFYAFGEDFSPSDDANSKHLTSPVLIHPDNGFNYDGTPKDATVASTGESAQGLLLTTDGLYVWGKNNIIYDTGNENSRGMFSVPLPQGIIPADIRRIEASYKVISLITNSNEGYVYSLQHASNYGDGSTVLDGQWHKIALNNIKYLKHNYEGFFAYTTDNNYYTWGNTRLYLGDATGAKTNLSIPTLMTSPFSDEPKMILLGVSGTYFALNSVDKKIYTLGSNHHGILGQGNSSVNLSNSNNIWSTVKSLDGTSDLEDIVYISTASRAYTSTVTPTAGAINSARELFLWGYNHAYILSDEIPRDTNAILPIIPTGFIQGESKAMYIENGGHITPYIDARFRKFGYVGHCFHGSMGVNDCNLYTTPEDPTVIKQYDFRNTPHIDFCAELPKIIESILTNPKFITVDVQENN